MIDREPTAAENEALRARISALSAASLRISASLDLETVLNEVVDSARALSARALSTTSLSTVSRSRLALMRSPR